MNWMMILLMKKLNYQALHLLQNELNFHMEPHQDLNNNVAVLLKANLFIVNKLNKIIFIIKFFKRIDN